MLQNQSSPARLCLLWAGIVFFTLSTLAQVAAPIDQRSAETLAPGIEHVEIKRGDFNAEAGDRWQIHVLIVDPSKASIKLARAMDEIVGAETTSSMATRHGALAAINAGFFRVAGIYRGEPNGILTIKGKLLSEAVNQRSALALTNAGSVTKAAFARIESKAELKLNGKDTIRINGFNRPRETDELIVFTPEFHRTTLTTPDGIEVIVRKGHVQEWRDGKGSQVIPPDGFVISASGAAKHLLSPLRRGIKVELNAQTVANPPLPFAPEFIIGGGPMLIVKGQRQTDLEGFNPTNFYNFRHPRTAIGIHKDGALVLVTVDGRQLKKSVGMTIPELMDLMVELGCEDALNLDGGGSTTMVIRNKIVNSISDATGERPVSDALMVIAK